MDLLRAGGRLQVSLVAEEEGRIVGHVAFSPVTIPGGLVGAGLAPVAVLESHQGKGIAARLVRAGLAACATRAWAGSWCSAIPPTTPASAFAPPWSPGS